MRCRGRCISSTTSHHHASATVVVSSRIGGIGIGGGPQNHSRRRFLANIEPHSVTATAAKANANANAHGITITNAYTASVTKRWHGGPHVDRDHAEAIRVTFVDAESKPIKEDAEGFVGESLLQVAQRNGIELEGACEGVCACSTCHVIFPDWDVFDSLEEASEDEEDMLDMAFGLTETSRLSCQIILTKELDGVTVEIPRATRNFYVDGHVPQPH
eukprot:jgi/Psemu1/309705/fgenesh1_kg.548_\